MKPGSASKTAEGGDRKPRFCGPSGLGPEPRPDRTAGITAWRPSREHRPICGLTLSCLHSVCALIRVLSPPLPSFLVCRLIKGLVLSTLLSGVAFAADPAPAAALPWTASAQNIEMGSLWEIGTGTPFHYQLVITQLSWRSKEFMEHVFADGYRIVVRHRLTLIGDMIRIGPESHYYGFSGSPSVELWNPEGTWSLYTGSGGGFGLVNSRNIKGALGQDFTLNWFIRGGIEHAITKNSWFSVGILYQHMSNGGMTRPNPGIDALGFTLGYTWAY